MKVSENGKSVKTWFCPKILCTLGPFFGLKIAKPYKCMNCFCADVPTLLDKGIEMGPFFEQVL